MSNSAPRREQLKAAFELFVPLFQQNKALNLIYSINAGAILWSLRDQDLVTLSDPLRLIVAEWKADTTPYQAALMLNQRHKEDEGLEAALKELILSYFDDLQAVGVFSQNTTSGNVFNFLGDVSAANLNFGTQTIWGDLIINQIRQPVATCPTAPNPPEHFTGRSQELATLREALAGGETVAITAVRAMGGMGKTSLAQAFCHQPDKPFDGVLWAPIGENPQAGERLREWARYAVDDYALKPDATPEEIAGWVRGQLTQLQNNADACGRRWLVVFDDVWNKQICYDAIALLQTALPPHTKILITTRQGDAASALQARSIELYELSGAEALAMLQRLRDNPHLTDEHLKRAVTLVKGHPLTLEIAIASLNKAEDAADIDWILGDYARGIADGSPFDALNLGVETPRSLNVVFGRSYKALSEADQAHFRALGLFPPDVLWDRPLAGALWAIEIEDERKLSDAHKRLRLAAFIQQQATPDSPNAALFYQQHSLLRAYARALLNQTDEAATTFDRYAAHLTELAELFWSLPPEEWGQLEPYFPHFHALGDELVARWETEPQTPNWPRR